MNSKRPKGDMAWDFLRPLPSTKPYIWMKPLGDDVYELVVLDGLQTKVVSNSDDPPRSFHTRDLFVKHPVITDAWKSIGRLDDRVTLMNGEKFLPLRIEGKIRQHPMIREAVVFGVGREYPGLLLFRSEQAERLSSHDFVAEVWPTVEEANSAAEAFSQISSDMIIPVAANVECPQTDKGTAIRAQVYQVFEKEIANAYTDDLGDDHIAGPRLDLAGTKAYLLDISRELLGPGLQADSNLFAAGLDSLKAMQLSTRIRNDLYSGHSPKRLDQNTIFEQGDVNNLAIYLNIQPHDSGDFDGRNALDAMSYLIAEYSVFKDWKVTATNHIAGHYVVGNAVMLYGNVADEFKLLTGASGSLGSHILAQLLQNPETTMVYVLVRTATPSKVSEPFFHAIAVHGVYLSTESKAKIRILPGDFSRQGLGFDDMTLVALQKLTLIIHCAWTVNFNLPLASFSHTHIAGVKNLLDLSLSVSGAKRARFVFCSSIAVAANHPRDSPVAESLITDPSYAQGTGYAISKYVAEHIVGNASKLGADVCICRIGQLVGDTAGGKWNAEEAAPLMIRSVGALGCLPALDEVGRFSLSLPPPSLSHFYFP